MMRPVTVLAAVVVAMTAIGCDERLPLTWQPAVEPAITSPEGFERLWSTNCAGCHGADGSHGPSRPMRDPVYLASVSDDELVRAINEGSPKGTLMPGFARAAGGALSDDEVNAIVSGMRRAWGSTEAKPSSIPYAAPTAAGDPTRGKVVYEQVCLVCHADGSAADPFALQLVSDQFLRSTIIFGRVDLGMPGADGPFPEQAGQALLTAQEVDDIVAWLTRRRTEDWPPASIKRGGRP